MGRAKENVRWAVPSRSRQTCKRLVNPFGTERLDGEKVRAGGGGGGGTSLQERGSGDDEVPGQADRRAWGKGMKMALRSAREREGGDQKRRGKIFCN